MEIFGSRVRLWALRSGPWASSGWSPRRMLGTSPDMCWACLGLGRAVPSGRPGGPSGWEG
eukprot:6980447-Alexandrium_andersonii.AAC.1